MRYVDLLFYQDRISEVATIPVLSEAESSRMLIGRAGILTLLDLHPDPESKLTIGEQKFAPVQSGVVKICAEDQLQLLVVVVVWFRFVISFFAFELKLESVFVDQTDMNILH